MNDKQLAQEWESQVIQYTGKKIESEIKIWLRQDQSPTWKKWKLDRQTKNGGYCSWGKDLHISKMQYAVLLWKDKYDYGTCKSASWGK